MPRQKSDHVDSAEALAARLREARREAGLSQRALARGICTPAYVSRLEKGERIPSLQLLRRLAERLSADADELALGVRGGPADPLLDAELALRLGGKERSASLAMDASDLLAEASPSDAGRAYALVADVFAELGDRARAIELYELAAEKRPVDGRARRDLATRHAELLEQEGRKDDALEVLKRAIQVKTEARDRA